MTSSRFGRAELQSAILVRNARGAEARPTSNQRLGVKSLHRSASCPENAHLLVRLTLKETFPDFMKELKASSSAWAKRKHQPKFAWQRRYGAFTVSESAADAVREYIRDQKEHHKKRSFEDEYKALLKRHNIGFDEKYLWE